jgi:hypothetical protein
MADIEITLRIPEAKIQEFRTGFLEVCPVPTENVANPGDPPDIQPKYTEKQWLKVVIRYSLIEKYREGKVKLAKDSAVIDETVVEE